MSSETVEAVVAEIEDEIKAQYSEVRRLFIEVQSEQDHMQSVSEDRAKTTDV